MMLYTTDTSMATGKTITIILILFLSSLLKADIY